MQRLPETILTENGLTGPGKILVSLFVVLGVVLLTRGISHLVSRGILKKQGGVHSQKTQTVITVLSNGITVIIAFWGLMYILELFGINTRSILATAGIGGIAIGFGAQSLVKDIITGAFLLLGDQYVLGDYIRAGGAEGYVTRMNLRTTTVRAFNGEITHIPNGSITTVTNISREPMRALAEIRIPYEVDPDEFTRRMDRALAAHAETFDGYTTDPAVLGISGYTDFHYLMTIVGHTVPMQQWAAERAFRDLARGVLGEIRREEETSDGKTAL